MKMGIWNLSKAPQVTKTDTEGIQNHRNLVIIHRLMPTINLKKQQQMPSTGQVYEKMPLHGNLALYRNDRPANTRGRGIGTLRLD